MIRIGTEGQKGDLTTEQLMGPFAHFTREYEKQDLNAAHKFLAQKFKADVDILHQLVKDALFDPRLEQLFTREMFKALFCLMCLNAQGVGTSALEQYEREIYELEDPSKEVEEVKELLEALEPDIEEHSG